jgi:hypothetical protein
VLPHPDCWLTNQPSLFEDARQAWLYLVRLQDSWPHPTCQVPANISTIFMPLRQGFMTAKTVDFGVALIP